VLLFISEHFGFITKLSTKDDSPPTLYPLYLVSNEQIKMEILHVAASYGTSNKLHIKLQEEEVTTACGHGHEDDDNALKLNSKY